jgi:quercetin dioxygenase-like cupin family protein
MNVQLDQHQAVHIDRRAQWEAPMKRFDARHPAVSGLAVCFTIGLSARTVAQHSGSGEVKSIQLSHREIIENLDGKDARAAWRVVTIAPGQKDSAHRHAGPVFGYVLEGEYEHAMDDEPIKTYKAGENFYEPSGSVHRVAQNPSGKTQTRLLAVILHPRDAKQVTIREKDKE